MEPELMLGVPGENRAEIAIEYYPDSKGVPATIGGKERNTAHLRKQLRQRSRDIGIGAAVSIDRNAPAGPTRR